MVVVVVDHLEERQTEAHCKTVDHLDIVLVDMVVHHPCLKVADSEEVDVVAEIEEETWLEVDQTDLV